MKKSKLSSKQVIIRLTLSIFMLTICSLSKAQNTDNFDKNNYYPISKNTFINVSEITNKDYNYFLEHYSGEVSDETLAIQNQLWTNSELNLPLGLMNKELYHSTKMWEKHPVVNVNQEAAKTYCEWLTEVYSSKSDRAYQKVVFRLPTEKEWMKAYKEVKNKIEVQTEKLKYSEKFPCKEKKLNEEEKKLEAIHDEYKEPSPEKLMKMEEIDMSKIKDDFQARPVDFFRETYEAPIYNLVGNVSEWLSEEKQAIASNWNVKNDKDMKELIAAFEAESPSPLIGFRIVMEVIEE